MSETNKRFFATTTGKSPLLVDRKRHIRQPRQPATGPWSVCESKSLEQDRIDLVPCKYRRHGFENARGRLFGRDDQRDQLLCRAKCAGHQGILDPQIDNPQVAQFVARKAVFGAVALRLTWKMGPAASTAEHVQGFFILLAAGVTSARPNAPIESAIFNR